MSHVPTMLKSDRLVFEKMLPVDDNASPLENHLAISFLKNTGTKHPQEAIEP